MFFPIFTSTTSSPIYTSSSCSHYDYYSLKSEVRSLKYEKSSLNDKIIRLETNIKYNKEFIEFFKKSIKEINDQINADLFQVEPFNNEEINNFVNLINSITEEEQYEEKLFQEVKNISFEYAKRNKSVKHLNIILVGPTGVGKSTLINTILNFDEENKIKTGIGIPCTMGEPKYYESEAEPLLRLADSRGLEKAQYRVEELNQSIDKFIKSQLDSGNPDYFVHCIWYCITGTRLEQVEMDILKELSKIYKSNSIPIIIVYTQAISKIKSDEMGKFIKENFNHDFIPILAKKEIINENMAPIEPSGMDKLKEISVQRAKEAVKSSCYTFNLLKTKKEVQDIINNKKENLAQLLNNIIEEKIEIMSEGKKKEEIYEDLKNLLIYIISNHIYINERN